MSNPFSTRFVRPGSIPFIFPQAVDADRLVERLQQLGWQAAIVGPHGSGKSTLLEALIPAIERSGRTVKKVVLRDGQRSLPPEFNWPEPTQAPGVVVVDGYEQLGWWSRRKLQKAIERSGWGLLVTVHALPERVRLPELFHVQPTLEVFQQVVARLLAVQGASLRPEDIAAAFREHPENLREALFTLYDVVEHRRAS